MVIKWTLDIRTFKLNRKKYKMYLYTKKKRIGKKPRGQEDARSLVVVWIVWIVCLFCRKSWKVEDRCILMFPFSAGYEAEELLKKTEEIEIILIYEGLWLASEDKYNTQGRKVLENKLYCFSFSICCFVLFCFVCCCFCCCFGVFSF